MNSKVAKLIDLFAAETQVSSRALKVRYRGLTTTQKRDFRHLMSERLRNVLGGQEVQDFGAMNWRDRWHKAWPHLLVLAISLAAVAITHWSYVVVGWVK